MKRISCWLAVSATVLLATPALAQQSPPAAEAQPLPQPAPPNPPLPEARDVAYPGTLKIAVDATDLDRRIFRIKETIPVAAAGPLTLLYPQWIPGNHGPSGQVYNIAGLTVRAAGQVLPWVRDSANVFAFHVEVPAGAASLDVEYQYLSPTAASQGRVVVTPEMLNLQWISQVLYPAGYFTRRIPIEASVTLPDGWGFGTALEVASKVGPTTTFKPVPLETLADSPMFAGKYYRQIDITPPGASPVRLNLVADSPSSLESKPEQIEAHRRLVVQADKLFGARHYDHYDFLVASTEKLGGIGLEHHRSTEIDVPVKYFSDWDRLAAERNVIAHEYVHSWNGKFRRGADLWTPTWNTPMRDSLMWVYEGQTQFWGYVLAARSGLASKDETLEYLAGAVAAYGPGRPGRDWRSLVDTTNDPIISGRRPQPWASWQRSEDYYTEGLLVWLDADTLIREKTGGKKSLDDFARGFFGVNDGSYTPLTYTFDDVVKGLNAVVPYDWASFLKTRVEGVGPEPTDGITRGGYRLAWGEAPTKWAKDIEEETGTRVFTYSLGFTTNREAALTTVLWDSPAFKAGLTVGQTIVAVNGESYTLDRLKAAITAAKGAGPAVELLMKAGDRYRTVKLGYHDGLRYPRLEKLDPKGKSSLDALLEPRK